MEKRVRRGEAAPSLASRPTLHPLLAWIYEGYATLSRARPRARREPAFAPGGGAKPGPVQVAPIRPESVVAWLDALRVDDPGVREEGFSFVLRMDAAFRSFVETGSDHEAYRAAGLPPELAGGTG
jgi:hypothetical protein